MTRCPHFLLPSKTQLPKTISLHGRGILKKKLVWSSVSASFSFVGVVLAAKFLQGKRNKWRHRSLYVVSNPLHCVAGKADNLDHRPSRSCTDRRPLLQSLPLVVEPGSWTSRLHRKTAVEFWASLHMHPNGACAHYVMVSRIQWKLFWFATQQSEHVSTKWLDCMARAKKDFFRFEARSCRDHFKSNSLQLRQR